MEQGVKHIGINELADQLERSFRGGAWHGPATWEALAGIDAKTGGRKLPGSAHTISEIVRHISFWLDAARIRLAGGDVASDEDWRGEESPTDEAWARTKADLERAFTRLHAALLDLSDDRLDDPVPGCDPTVRGLLLGILQHNAYHTGQIVQIARQAASLQANPSQAAGQQQAAPRESDPRQVAP